MKSSKFELGNGDIVKLVEFDNYAYVHDSESGCTITSTNHFEYIQRCYSALVDDYDIGNHDLCVIHLGVGFGYDLLYVHNLLKTSNHNIRIVGVDLIDYGDLRVSLDRFQCPIELHSQDVMEYLATVDPHDFKSEIYHDSCIVVFVDLFLKGDAPISLVYEKKLWEAINHKINPTHVVVNRCNGADTYPVVADVMRVQHYKKSGCLEFYKLTNKLVLS